MGIRLIMLAAVGVLAAGCLTNPYSRTFTPSDDLAERQPYLAESTGPALILEGTEMAYDLESMRRQGYDAVGYSEFEGRLEPEGQARGIARDIGANRVLIYREDLGTHTGLRPVFTRSFAGFDPWRFGYGGFRGCRTGLPFYGPRLTYVPYAEQHFRQVAVYYAPILPGGLGIFVRELTDAEQASLATKDGAVITAVVDGSPAARAGLQEGDIVLEIDGRPMDPDTLAGEMIPPGDGKAIPIVVDRDGQRQSRVLHLD